MNTSAAIHPMRRLLAFFMTLAMLLSALPLAEITAAAASNGFTLSLTWEEDDGQYFKSEQDYKDSGATHEDVADPDTFVSYSKTGEDAYVRLRVHYENPLISSGYAPRGITIRVTGLRGAVRDSDEAPEAIIAADELSSASKRYIWSYSYNSVEDAYYFTNNNAIDENAVFEGTFEIAWKLKPRETMHDFGTTVSATLLASGYTVTSNELKYQQKRLKDYYELELHASNPYKYEVPFEAVNERYGTQLDLENAIWVKYNVSGKDEYKARDLVDAEEFRVYFPNALAAYMASEGSDDFHPIVGDGSTKTENGITYKGYTITKDIDENSASPYLRSIFVAYPEGYREELLTTPAIAELWGRYHEDKDANGALLTAKALIAAGTLNENPEGGYGYQDIPGDIYDVYKTSHGDHSTSIDRLVGDDADGAIEAQYLRGGNEYTSDLELYLNFDNLKNAPHTSESTDDTQNIAEIAASSEELAEDAAESIAEPESVEESEPTSEDIAELTELSVEDITEPDATDASEEITETDVEEPITEEATTEERIAEESDADEITEDADEYSMDLLPAALEELAAEDDYPDIQSYNVEFVDDFIDIQTIRNNAYGGLRQLTDDEYHFTSVDIASTKDILNDMQQPIKGENVTVEVYGRLKGEDYTFAQLLGSTTLSDQAQNISFSQDDVVGVKVVFKGFTENIGSFKPADEWQGNNDTDLNRAVLAKCNYVFHISEDEMRYIATDGTGKVINNMFCNVYYVDDQNNPVWFNTGITYNDYRENDKDSYDYTFNRDQNIYAGLWGLDSNHGFDREKGELPIVEIPNYFKMDWNTISRSTSSDTVDTYFFYGNMQASFELIDETRLYNFSLYTIIPEHLRLESSTKGTFIKNGGLDEELLKSILTFSVTGEDSSKLSSAYIAENCHITLIDDPNEYNGRQYLAFNFTFDDPISIETLQITGLPMSLQQTEIQNGTISIIMRAAVMVHQPEHWQSNNTDAVDYEGGVWYNIDRDETYNEPASFSQANVSIVKVTETHREIIKYVETPLTKRSNPNPTQVRGGEREAPVTYRGGEYTYILSGNLTSSEATDLIVVDVMEPDKAIGKGYTINNGKPEGDTEPEYTDWQGTFVSIDYSSIKKALGMKSDPIVYYSDLEEDVPEIITRDMFTVSDVHWTTELNDLAGPVRSVALDFGDAVAQPDTDLLIKINMLAPSEAKWGGYLAINQWHLGYTDVTTQESETLNSNVVPVTIVPDSRIILTKKDGTDKSLMDGVWFTLYDENDNELAVYSINNGRIIVDNLTEGSYYFKETSERKTGYQENTKQYWFTVSNTGAVAVKDTDEKGVANEIIVYNERLAGQVTIQKISDRKMIDETDPENSIEFPVDGAKFSLYGKNGELAENLETGKSYIYDASTGTMTEKPQEDLSGTGKLHITRLEWGDYYLLETEPASGYELTKEVKVSFTISSQNDAGANLSLPPIENKQKPGYIKLVKYELDGDPYAEVTDFDDDENGQMDSRLLNPQEPIANAVYDLYRYVEKDDTAILVGTYFTNNKGELYVGDLAFGTYYFKENTAALGYEIYGELDPATNEREPRKIWFEIGPEDTESKKTDEIRAIYTSDSRILGEVTLWKTDDYSTPQPVVGAEYAMYKVTGVKTETDHETDEEITIYEYDEDAKLSFINEGGFYIYLRDGTSGDEKLITNNEGMLEIKGLIWGKYLLKEIKAPTGYQLSNKEFYFDISAETVADKVYCYDTDARIKGTVKLVKVKEEATPKSITDPDDASLTYEEYAPEDRLDGAVFSIYREDGSLYVSGIQSGFDYRIDTVDGVRKAVQIGKAEENGTSNIMNMDWGRYYFLETEAPEGRGLNPDKIRFSVSAQSASLTQEIVVMDPVATCELKVTKKILKADIVFAHGDPTFIFQLKQIDGEDVGRTFTKSLTFDEDYVNNPENVDEDGYVIASVTFSVPQGTYEVSEIGVNRYELEEIDLKNPTKGLDDADVPQTPSENDYPVQGNQTITVELNDTDYNTDPIEFIFKNKKKDQTGTSDTASVSNLISKKRRLTAITAEYTGPTVFRDAADTPDWDDPDEMDGILTVIAIYDDGSEERIYFKDSNINPDPEDKRFYTLLGTDAETGDATITVVYIEDGIRKTATFTITFQTDLFEWWAMVEDGDSWAAQDGQFDLTPYTDPVTGKEYDGTVCIIGYLGTASSVTFPAELLTADDEGNDVLCKVVQVGGIPNNRVEGSGELQVYGMLADDSDNKNGIPPAGKKIVTAIQFGDGIEIIGQEAFQGRSLIRGKLMIPPSMKEIRYKAFDHCSGLTGLTFTDPTASSLTYIGSSAFEACSSLTGNLILPDSVTEMGETVFYGCTGFNGRLHVPDSVTGIRNGTFYGGKFISVEMPDSITKIGMGAFYGGSFSTVDLPDALTEISVDFKDETIEEHIEVFEGAFQSCTSLQTVTFPSDSLEIIGFNAFRSCSKLLGTDTNGMLEIPSSVTKIGYGAFYSCSQIKSLVLHDGLEEISVVTTVKNPNAETPIEQSVNAELQGAFGNCMNLAGNLYIPETVKIIGYNAFYFCMNLTGGLIIPESVTDIGYGAFYDCMQLTSLTFTGNNLKRISVPTSEVEYDNGTTQKITNAFIHGSFEGCQLLKGELELPSSVELIGYKAFSGCVLFTGTLEIPANVKKIGFGAFYNDVNLDTLILHEGTLTEISVQVYDQVKAEANISGSSIGAFSNCFGFTNGIWIPDSVQIIGDYSFYNCNKESGAIAIGKDVIYIGRSAFEQCRGITEIKFENTDSNAPVMTISDYAFFNIRTVSQDVTLPPNVIEIGDYAFQRCSEDSDLNVKLKLNEGLITIGRETFSDNGGFKGDLTIPDSVTTIGIRSFNSCGFNGTLQLGTGLTEIPDSAFANCEFTGSLTIPNNVTTLGNQAFYNSGFTENLTIGNGLTSIDTSNNGIFGGCGFTGDLTVNSAVGSFTVTRDSDYNEVSVTVDCAVNSDMFKNCKGFRGSLTVGGNVKGIDTRAFSGFGFEKNLTIGDSVTTLNSYIIENCPFKGDLTIGSGLDTVYFAVFYNFTSSFEGDITINSGDAQHGKIISGYLSGTFKESTGKLTIGDKVEEIRNSLFKNFKFTSLSLGNGVKTIGNNAFEGCSSITGSLILPESLVSIGNAAFYNCSGFTGDLTIPDNVTTIGQEAFYGCRGFNGDLTIGSGVTSINDGGWGPFGRCGFTGDLTIKGGNNLAINRKMFSNSDNTPLPFTGNLTIGTSDENSGVKTLSYASCYTVGTTTPAFGAFQEFGFKGKLTIGASVKSISHQAFFKTSFSDLEIEDSTVGSVTVGMYAFQYWDFPTDSVLGQHNVFVLPKSIASTSSQPFNATNWNGYTFYVYKDMTATGTDETGTGKTFVRYTDYINGVYDRFTVPLIE